MKSKKSTTTKKLSSKQAGELLGYTHDYISRLCRIGEIKGTRKGREWFISKFELDAFKKRHELVLQEKKKQLSKKLSKIRKEQEYQKKQIVTTKSDTLEKKPFSNITHKRVSVESYPKAVRFHVPKRLVAIGMLALIIGIMSLFESSNFETYVDKDLRSNISNVASVGTVNSEISSSFGLSNLLKSPINVLRNIGDSYLTLYVAQGYVIYGSFDTWGKIGNAYLAMYIAQGHIINNSFKDIAYVGETVLQGYEILGSSLILGTKDLFYKAQTTIQEGSSFSKKKLNSFLINVNEGFDYAFSTISDVAYTYGFKYVAIGSQIIFDNIKTNTNAMMSIINESSNSVISSVSQFTNMNQAKKQEIIKIER